MSVGKKIALTCFLMIFVGASSSIFAQGISVKSLIGYRVAGNVNTPSGIIMPRESFNWQGVVEYELGDGLSITASYLTSPSAYKFRPVPHDNWTQLGELRVSHLMAGVTYTHTASFPAVRPFGGVRVGGITYSSSTPEFESTTKFGISVEGGVKVPFSPRFGLVTQINIFTPITFSKHAFFETTLEGYDFTGRGGIYPIFALNSGLYYNIW